MKNLNKDYKIKIRLKSFINIDLIQNYLILLRRLLFTNIKSKNLYLSNTITLEKNLYKNTIIRSPHVNKQSQEQFEIRTYNCLIILNLKSLTYNSIKNILRVIKSNIPIGFDFHIILMKTYTNNIEFLP